MNFKLVIAGIFSLLLLTIAPACNQDKTGCTDSNADNYDSKANKAGECRYRYASNMDISNIPPNKSDGTPWDDGDGPDVKVNFGKSSSAGYDYTTSSAVDATVSSTITVIPGESIKFTNEEWKYQIVDVDLLGNDVISTGTFKPLSGGLLSNTVTVENNGVTIKFRYTIK